MKLLGHSEHHITWYFIAIAILLALEILALCLEEPLLLSRTDEFPR